jgi:hypothetical protein
VNLSARRLPDYLCAGLIAAGLSIAYARTLAPGVTWANGGSDSGDFITAAATIGVAHPTGYPTYLLLARLFQLLPFGDLAVRTNALSAVSAIPTVLCVYVIVRLASYSTEPQPGVSAGSIGPGARCRLSTIAAAIAAIELGTSPVFWSQAVIAEVYSLTALFIAMIVLFTLQGLQGRASAGRWAERLHALVAGLALGTHVIVAIPIAIWLAVASKQSFPRARLLLFGPRLLLIGLGMLVYLYLPLRAPTHPAINWGNPRDWDGFWWVISGQPYRELAFGLPQVYLTERVAASARLLVQQFGWIGIGLGFFGLLYGSTSPRSFIWLTAGTAVILSIFAITYDTADSYTYFIPVYLIFAIWIGLGSMRLLEQAARWHSHFATVLTILMFAGMVWRASIIARQVDASQDRAAIVYSTSVLKDAPAHAIVVTSSDRDTFALWYYHYALGWRPDITLVAAPLLDFEWYRDHLGVLYPTLHLPEQQGAGWDQELTALNQALGPVCRTTLAHQAPLSCDTP